tara:strand:+ start:321 stop:818 length:498 start_codon:yes stop_codon:yes gene_type:complete
MSNEIKTLATGFIAANTNKIKITAFITNTYTSVASGNNGEQAEKDLVELWNLITNNPKDCADRKKAIASFKSLMNRVTKKVNADLDNGLRAMVVKDDKLVEAQIRGSNSGEGGEGGEEGGNTSTDAPMTITTTPLATIATLTDMIEGATVEQQAALQIAIKALSI